MPSTNTVQCTTHTIEESTHTHGNDGAAFSSLGIALALNYQAIAVIRVGISSRALV